MIRLLLLIWVIWWQIGVLWWCSRVAWSCCGALNGWNVSVLWSLLDLLGWNVRVGDLCWRQVRLLWHGDILNLIFDLLLWLFWTIICLGWCKMIFFSCWQICLCRLLYEFNDTFLHWQISFAWRLNNDLFARWKICLFGGQIFCRWF